MIDTEQEEWDIELTPENNMLDLKLKDIWHYRDLLVLLVRRDFVSFYKQTILGPLWFFIQPLFTTIIYTFVFGNLASISTDGLPQPLFYLAGITAWNYFADCLGKTSSVFVSNAGLFGKVYFPRLIVPLSIVVSNLIRFAVQMLLFIIMMGAYWAKGATFHPNAYLLLFPVLLLLMAMLGLGLGMIISAMTTKYRDLTFLISFGVQLMMYLTTVIYPLSTVKAKYPKYQWMVEYNPMTSIIEAFRYGFLGKGTFTMLSLAITTVITCFIMLIGIIVFNRVERNFIDTV
ncbi:ABC transporter permease [Mucilaginibacter xinganensis]|uniref:Transport permease protein n=1 Tax=Mucilaginibacter xinganensis TaxID=1234841 RepID=A0A223P3W1_9SPHI|nr:ABC transporter permease [Mucilaginibacter xinganensis]ASU36807.1 lipopolysaccharide transport system permease protein [Mucilaginibacter xinganensis]